MLTISQLVIINTVLALVNTGILVGLCIDKREWRNEICKEHKRIMKEFDRIYDAECDHQYELNHLKDKEK